MKLKRLSRKLSLESKIFAKMRSRRFPYGIAYRINSREVNTNLMGTTRLKFDFTSVNGKPTFQIFQHLIVCHRHSSSARLRSHLDPSHPRNPLQSCQS